MLLVLTVAGLVASALVADLAGAEEIASIQGDVARTTGEPVSDVVVDLFTAQADGSRGRYLGSTATGPDGRYRFGLEQVACHVVVVIAPDGLTFVGGSKWHQRTLCIPDGSTSVSLSSRLGEPTASIEGSVTYPTGTPVAGVTFDLFEALADGSRGQYHRSVVSDDAGRYRFSVADASCYVVVGIGPRGQTFTNGSPWDQLEACFASGSSTVRLTSTLNVPVPDPDPDPPPPPPPPPPDPDPPPPDPDPPPPPPGADENLDLILSNPTRVTRYDSNPFRGVPMDQIALSDLTVNGDIYDEALLDTTYSGYFRVHCEFSHFAYDDPIVFPDEPGRAHLHMFFGNTEAHAYSTFDSLLNSGTGTCNGEDLNRSSYWIPAVLDAQGNALIPSHIMVYYKNDNFLLNGHNELVNPFPDNLRMIAGNAGARSPQTELTGPGSFPIISFACGPAYRSDDRRQNLMPDCYGGGNQALELTIAFPACHNPAAGTYRPDQSHMSYPDGGYYAPACPSSHPYDISSIMYRIFFFTSDFGGALENLHLSSDVLADQILPGGTTLHADWFGAWHPEAMDMWVENCNNTRADCEVGLLDRDPALSMVKRKVGPYPRGDIAPAQELIQLCPGKTYNPAMPLHSVANCHHGDHG